MPRTASPAGGVAPRRWPHRLKPARLIPVRLILFGVVFALVLPGILFCAILMDRIRDSEAARAEAAVQAATSRLAESMDREIGNLAAALVALATSPALEDADLAAFDLQARTLAGVLGQSVLLIDPAGRKQIDTTRPRGQFISSNTTPPTPQTAPTQPTATRTVTVTGLFPNGITPLPSVAILLPVLHAAEPNWTLAINLQPQYLATLLATQSLPPGWTATVADAQGTVLASINDPAPQQPRRTAQPRTRPGQPALATIDEARPNAGSPQPPPQGASLLGTQWLRMADWHVAIQAPWWVLQRPFRGTVILLGITGIITLLMALIIAWRLAASVAAPLQSLAALTATPPNGNPNNTPHPIRCSIAEVEAVATALLAARTRAARFTADLEHQVQARTTQLQDANQRLREALARGEQAEEQLRQAQKMEAVGQLTGGIAHDFNNMLTVVIGSLDLLRRRAPEDRQQRLIDNAMEGANRAARLTARLLAFSRRQPLQPQPVDVNALVTGMSALLHRTLGPAIQLETVLAGGLWPAHADPNQLENALLNLAVNGRDALTEAGHPNGRLTIETSNATLAAPDLDPDVQPGTFIRIAVSDGGIGMPPEILARVFEPFFTTKPQAQASSPIPGTGTGLGLSQVHGFVKQTGGQVRIRTAPGQGTTVTIHLPRVQQEADAPGRTRTCDQAVMSGQL